MSRLINHAVRAGASAVGVAAGLMFLASTSQTPDGFTQASFNGPLGIFGDSAPEHPGDVIAVGDGTGDTSELAAILNRPIPTGNPDVLHQEAFNAGIGPNRVGVTAIPTAALAAGAPTSKQSLGLPTKSVVDAQGHIDCTGSVSCLTDPATHVTTVTYPDGVVALIQQINDMTVVAYQTVANAILPDGAKALFGSSTAQAPLQIPMPGPAAAAPVQAPAQQTQNPVAESAPSAAPVSPEISASTVRPQLTVAPTPQELAPGQNRGTTQSGTITIPPVKPTSPFDVVKDAFNSVVNVVTGHHASQTKKPTGKTPKPSPTSNPPSDSATDSANPASNNQDSSGDSSP
jgi:hypothetical protein